MALSHSPSIVTDGLVLCLDAGNKRSYPGSGTVWSDLSGNGNNGTLTNGPTFSDGSLVFDGVDDYSSCGALSDSFLSFTVIIWFYPISITSYENPIDCNYLYGGGASNVGPRLEIDSIGKLVWVYSNSTFGLHIHNVLLNGLLSNIWHCAAITYNSSNNTSITYYNGNNTGFSRTGTGIGFVGFMSNINIGRGYSLSGERIFTGRVSVVQIYNKALSSKEIKQNYLATKGRFNL